MAGTNDFKAFATDANANVTSQEEWETLTALKKGFSSGKASSAQVSKALRQPSTMAAVLGQFIANAELDALDDGDVDGLVAKLATAITTNLGLGEAAKRNVGTGENQVPDMNSFGNSLTANGYQKLPGGMIIQWGSFSVSPTGGSVGTVDITLPVAFPAACRSVNALISTNDPSARSVGFDIGSTNRTKIRFTYTSATTNSIYWMAVGY